jgi:hypothetical protein
MLILSGCIIIVEDTGGVAPELDFEVTLDIFSFG